MDVLLLLGFLVLLGSVVSAFHRAFRAYWIFALTTATTVAVLYQLGAYVAQGYLDPFYKIAFVVSWIAFFAVVSIGYVIHQLIAKQKGKSQTSNQGPQS